MTGRAFACQPVAGATATRPCAVTMTKDQEREERLAAALRENLQRRKAQSRELAEPKDSDSSNHACLARTLGLHGAMRFFSDNAAPAHPNVLEAIAAANRLDTAYDGDEWSKQLDGAFPSCSGRTSAPSG